MVQKFVGPAVTRMSYIRFNHVFSALLFLSLLSAFVIPRRYTTKAQPQVQAVFAPVSVPAARTGAWARRQVGADAARDRRSVAELVAQNEALRNQYGHAQAQLELTRQRMAEWERLGPIADLCVPVGVVGQDAGTRESFALRGSTLREVREGMYVLYAGGLVGRVSRAGLAGAQARLVTDLGFRVEVKFRRLVMEKQEGRAEPVARTIELQLPSVVAEGVGDAMAVRGGLELGDVTAADLKPGDWAVVADRELPLALQGQRVADVVKVEPMRNAPLFAEIRLEPSTNLRMLREVMVMTK